ncbi:MAG: hypothetical protein PVSMB2_32120 [Ktedonobacteraceae bacterium]
MRQIHVKEVAVLDARPEDVYATIADYRNGHPHIIPKESLYDLQVEQGGYGAFNSRFLRKGKKGPTRRANLVG